MEMLFRASDLETRFAMNMNVLIDGRTPQVCSLKEVLRAFLDHRRDVLLRRARFRLDKIDARLEMLDGLLIAYPQPRPGDRRSSATRTSRRPALMAEFAARTTSQAEAILNMRLRTLRRLEEMELRAERDALIAERAGLPALLGDEDAAVEPIADELREVRKHFGKDAPRRRAPHRRSTTRREVEECRFEAMIEREPITVVCSEMGWIRAMKGHLARRRRAQVQGRRRPALPPPRRDHRPAPADGLERADLHARLRRRCPAAAAWASRCG